MEDKVRRASTTQQVAVLLSLGDVKYDVLRYPNAHPNIQILEMSTRYLRNREK